LVILSKTLEAYARDRLPAERFGDFVMRTIDQVEAA
jgi:hypothetical protein